MAAVDKITDDDIEMWRRLMGWNLQFLSRLRMELVDRPALLRQAVDLESCLAAVVSSMDQVLADGTMQT